VRGGGLAIAFGNACLHVRGVPVPSLRSTPGFLAFIAATGVAGIACPAFAEDQDPAQRERVEVGSPLPLDRAAAAMSVPPGFRVTLFAGEPDVHQPIAATVDPRGRLWVAENDAYPKWEAQGRDRIVIFTDSDGDGRSDRRTVFAEGFRYLSGVLVGLGGVWVLDTPQLLFFPVGAEGERPAGPPVVHLDGWSAKGIHNLANSLAWGPDGWMYGCNGTIFDIEVGPPGTPRERRTRMNRGIWRYHPTRKQFEKFAEGTANPWGLDYDEQGRWVMSNNVVPHLWHVLQGGHYPRVNWGDDSNPHTYELLSPAADHLHWGGGDWTTSRGGYGVHSVAGGGHSHAGCLIYQGEMFPAEYRGSALMGNTHGHRLNRDALEPRGSGFVGRHRPDFLLANDPWFKAVTVQAAPDGSVYVLDWSDTGECHDVDVTDRAHGRIYRVSYGEARAVPTDLAGLGPEQWVALQASRNEWAVRQARTLLQGRGLDDSGRERLIRMFEGDPEPRVRLRALWTLHACGGVDEGRLLQAMEDRDASVRGWAVQFLAESRAPTAGAREGFARLAREDPSPAVRLYLASALQRMPLGERVPVLEALLQHGEDAADANLPLMYWYALEPVVAAQPEWALAQLAQVKLPKLRELMARRLAAKR
jgi:putative membrane-bound dehydrogenase-like protein